MSLLNDWINPKYLLPEEIKRISISGTKPSQIRYLVIDDFLRPSALKRILSRGFDESFRWDPLSEAHRRKLDSRNDYDRFFLSSELGNYLKSISGNLNATGSCASATESILTTGSKGYWIHSDRHGCRTPIQIMALYYLNREWEDADGGLLQLWNEVPFDKSFPRYDLQNYITPTERKRLDFLLTEKQLTLSEPAFTKSLTLETEIRPVENRLVLISLENSLGFHSVTPTVTKTRRTKTLFHQ